MPPPSPPHVVVVGGGIAGLAAAYAAHDAGARVTLLERADHVGGKATSHARDGWLLEGGPTGILGTHPVVEDLIRRAHLTDDRLWADDAAARRFLVRGGRLREVVPRPLAFLRAGILSLPGALRLASEPLVRPRRTDDPESVWHFAARRIGRQAADRLIAPMVLGVFAGDARQLSVRAAFPRLAALERDHGGLVRGMLARRRARQPRPDGPPAGPAGPGGRLYSFRHGLASLPLALATHAPFTIRTRTPATHLERTGDAWHLRTDDEPLRADGLVLAGEPWAMAPLLRPTAPALAGHLDAIACPPIAVVGLGYPADKATGVPRGFGVLIPRGEGFRVLGCLWDTYLFDHRSPDGHVLVRAMLGGAVDPEAAALDDETLQATVRHDLGRLLGLTADPTFSRIVRWPRAIPQYTLGHLARVAAIEAACDALPGLALTGNAYRGVAFARAATDGWEAGARVAASLSPAATSTPAS